MPMPPAALLFAERQARAHPAATARLLAASPLPEVAALLAGWPAPVAAAVLEEAELPWATRLLLDSDVSLRTHLLPAMRPTTAAALLRRLEASVRQRCLADLPERVALRLTPLLQFAPQSVGAQLDALYAALPADLTAAEAMERLREAPEQVDTLFYVTGADRLLRGQVELRRLLAAPAQTPLAELAEPAATVLAAAMPLARAAGLPNLTWWHTLPVVDEAGRFLGALRRSTLERLLGDADRDHVPTPGDALGELFRVGLNGLLRRRGENKSVRFFHPLS